MSLAEDLAREAEQEGRIYGCTVCAAIEQIEDPTERAALAEWAQPGKMGVRALIRVSQKHGLGIGRAGIIRHRSEEHTP